MDLCYAGVIHCTLLGGHFPVNDFRYNLTAKGYNAVYESLTMAPDGAASSSHHWARIGVGAWIR